VIVGIDVYHAKKKENYQRRSIGGFVAAIIKPDGTHYTYCESNTQAAREEISGKKPKQQHADILEEPEVTQKDALANFLQNACNNYGVKPHHIIVFRDGLAESQLKAAKKYEIQQIKKAFNETAITFAVVQKRISTRFFQKGNISNPLPGTCISQDLRVPEFNSFYLIPTSCNISTVKPVQYIVIESGIPIDQLQQLAYTCCHLYQNWPGPVKLPFTTQMAHKLAYFIGEIKIQQPVVHKNLKTTMFYL